MSLEMAERTTILRGVVGSTVHGLHIGGPMEDRDEMGVCIEDIEHVVGLTRFEQAIHRTAAEREGRHDARSRAGDLDLTIFSLRKFLRLALKGNPTILLLLFVKPEDCPVFTHAGRDLQALAPKIISKRCGAAFMGYLESQRKRLVGERAKKSTRPELIEKYGFDTKFAGHAVRLGHQGIEMMATGRLTLPMPERERSHIRNVRLGVHSVEEVTEEIERLKASLRVAIDASPLPAKPDTKAVEAWMVSRYEAEWGRRRWSRP